LIISQCLPNDFFDCCSKLFRLLFETQCEVFFNGFIT